MPREHTTNVVAKLYADGRVERGEWKMTLSQMQEFVGGYIAITAAKERRRALVVDDEGILKERPVNRNATDLAAHENSGFGLVGDALLIKS